MQLVLRREEWKWDRKKLFEKIKAKKIPKFDERHKFTDLRISENFKQVT